MLSVFRRKKSTAFDRRKFLRIRSAIPVECRVVGIQKKTTSFSGFTFDVSRGGIRLRCLSFPRQLWDFIEPGKTSFQLTMHLPFTGQMLHAEALVSWKDETIEGFRYEFGLMFQNIQPRDLGMLLNFTWTKILIPRFIIGCVVVLFMFLVSTLMWNRGVVLANRNLVRVLANLNEEIGLQEKYLTQSKTVVRLLDDRIRKINNTVHNLQYEHSLLMQDYEQLQKKERSLHAMDSDVQEVVLQIQKTKEQAENLKKQIAVLQRENGYLRQELQKENSFLAQETERIGVLAGQKQQFNERSVQAMYSWIKRHQNQKTGLVVSFEGDETLENWAFSYDQSLAVFVFLLYNDTVSAEKILKFYLSTAKKHKDGFMNAYDARTGDPCEYIVHSGPNIWIGLAALRYWSVTRDKRYLELARGVFQFLTTVQDAEGGIRGGPEVNWYATEHNLDAYAFLLQLEFFLKDARSSRAKKDVLNWLRAYSYTKGHIPVNRGKGDATIATDTYAWSITAVGPEILLGCGMDPDAIIEFAIQKCKVSTFFETQNKKIPLEGFDFSRSMHSARGGVVSGEWTAQMILAFKIMAYFHSQKGNLEQSRRYCLLAEKYLNELIKMVVSSPSASGQGRGCLPYASSGNVDTGHGWRTPSGTTTGAVSSTAYYILAYKGFNPLNPELEVTDFSCDHE